MEIENIGGKKVLNFPFRPYPYELRLPPGKYKFEAWGSAGSTYKCSYSPNYITVRGGYVSGVITIKNAQYIIVYVGEKGHYEPVFNSQY